MVPWPARLGTLLVAVISGAAVQAGAQPPPPMGAREWNHVRFAGESEVRVRTAWEAGGGSAKVTLSVPGRAPVELHDGAQVFTAVATRGSVVFAAVTELSPGGELSLSTVDLAGDGRRRELTARFPGGRTLIPSTVIATPDADGFTVLWQALAANDLRGATTVMMRVRADGSWIDRPREVAVPWALADIAWNGRGYHLALYFDGQGPSETRLSMVTLSADGAPEQHPWWASQPGLVDEVQLVRAGDRIVAVYRGGREGTELRRRDVTDVGQWGGNVAPGATEGRITRAEEYVAVERAGRVVVERRRF